MSNAAPPPHPPQPPQHGARTLDYAQVDVFAERPLEGNMLAIFPDARGLSAAEMQALARETNLSETTFILPAERGAAAEAAEARDGVRVRIFTTQEELPFAGHPTLGTAAWLHWNHPRLRGRERITLLLKAGPITVAFRAPQHDEIPAPGVFATMQQADPVFGAVHPAAEVAPLLGLEPEDLDAVLPVQTVSTGIPFCIVPVRSPEALARLSLSAVAAELWLRKVRAKFFYCITAAAPGSTAHFAARMQFYHGEDPATGSASGCAIAYLVRHGVAAPGVPRVIEQGASMGRPSRLHVQAGLRDGQVADVFVGGRTIPVASGRFFLP